MNKTKIVVFFLVGSLAAFISPRIHAQTPPLPLGQISPQPGMSVPCPSGFADQMSCFSTSVVNCPGAVDIPLVYGHMDVTSPTQPKGTIVLLPGSGGTNANGDNVADFIKGVSYNPQSYPSNGYNVVQIAWGSYQQQNGTWVFGGIPWEDTTNNCPSNCDLMPPHNILNAACRPATFLNFIYNYYLLPLRSQNPLAGMCAQGFSGGSGAVAYALAWYGAGAWYGPQDPRNGYLDKVELLSGPVFSDIGKGCEFPTATPPTVCQNNPAFCEPLGPGIPQPNWEAAPIAYTDTVVQAMQRFTGDATCAGSVATSQAEYNNWESMSIVQNSASYSYSHTDVTGFACGSTPSLMDDMNNSSTQGWTFFNNPITTVSNNRYFLYEVDNCTGAEGIYANQYTQVPGVNSTPPLNGYTAILNDMVSGLNGVAGCTNHH